MNQANSFATESANYAMLTVEGRRLLLAQGEIRSLEPVADVKTVDPPVNGVGWISFQGGLWPVYCVDGDLRAPRHLPPARRVCVILNTDKGCIGILCDQIVMLKREQLKFCPMPVCMVSSDSPIKALVVYGDEVGCVITTAAITEYVGAGIAVEASHG